MPCLCNHLPISCLLLLCLLILVNSSLTPDIALPTDLATFRECRVSIGILSILRACPWTSRQKRNNKIYSFFTRGLKYFCYGDEDIGVSGPIRTMKKRIEKREMQRRLTCIIAGRVDKTNQTDKVYQERKKKTGRENKQPHSR